ncbi:non-reducing end alpha-L-arabinofuranosidase family hydrolase [Streptomyces acidicola]|uniref:non-reducing end alpha-L-arabinofuranosidase n=1 Tax=Streptomyces acidicola TaxID=2596892 RepID=A0A5N8WKD8_9ACTN|nr:non-reducing end alpha-L-arabinofuranosidase family hydrolase [Streptomyces acidicola]MPY47901.1 glycoside hydrolase [Streptomyces acidicola]
MPASVRRRPHPRLRRTAAAFVSGLALALALPAQASSAPPGPERAAATAAAELPSSFRWSSSGPLIAPKPDASHPVVSVKDPTVVQANGKWHVFMTTANTSGTWSLAQTSFTDWSQAASAPLTYLDTNPNIGTRYAAAPQVFYFAPKGVWYLVYQTGPPSYSTSTDPGNPQSWSAPRTFQNAAPSGTLDYWVICDSTKCYLFSADDNGHVYRSETTVGEFPGGFRNTQLVLQDAAFALFEGGAVYRVQGTDTYLLLWEAIGGDGRRHYRSFTAQGLTGQWQPLAATEANPFARSNNVTFPSGAWTADISHGELIRSGNDQTMTIDPCRLRFLYQGMNPSAGGDYSQLPWRLGLLTQTNSSC